LTAESTPPESGGAAPFRVPGPARRSFLESLFLGPDGVRAGWRVALYVALFLLFLLLLEMAAGFLHLLGAVRASAITPGVLIEQEVLSLVSALGATLVLGAYAAWRERVVFQADKSFWPGVAAGLICPRSEPSSSNFVTRWAPLTRPASSTAT